MPQKTYDCAVLGLGGFGSAAACHIARRGMSVLGIEQFTPAHQLGSSHGETRIIRQAYFEHPDYVPLLLRGYELFGELEEISKKKIVRKEWTVSGRFATRGDDSGGTPREVAA